MAEESVRPRCKPGDIGIIFQDDAPDEIHEAVEQYLSKFAAPENADGGFLESLTCFCGKPLAGLFGTFRWGLAYGEGVCDHCGAPVRGAHSIRDADGDELMFLPFTPLLYHPDYIEERRNSNDTATD